MGVQRVLALVGNAIAEYVGLQIGAGAASAGQLVALNAAGAVDVTMLPSMPLDVGADNDMATNGVFGIGPGVVASTDLGLASTTVLAVSDLGLASQPVTTTIDLGLASA